MAGVLSCCTATVKKSFGHIFVLVIHRHSVFWQLNNRVIRLFVAAGPNTLGVFELTHAEGQVEGCQNKSTRYNQPNCVSTKDITEVCIQRI
jgi:hypothetical protein